MTISLFPLVVSALEMTLILVTPSASCKMVDTPAPLKVTLLVAVMVDDIE